MVDTRAMVVPTADRSFPFAIALDVTLPHDRPFMEARN